MSRSAILSNGRLSVGIDERGFVNDFYYPLVGMHNMTSARFVHHKIGIYVDNQFSWLDDSDWEHAVALEESTMMSRAYFVNHKLGISLSFRDFVDHTIDFFGRVVIVENRFDQPRKVKLYFAQVFQMSSGGRGDTALYVPGSAPHILTYSGRISFATGLRTQDADSFDGFAVGNYGIEGKAGTYLDAEDGQLSGNTVEHGGVDSVIQTSFDIKPKGAYHIDYWITASDHSYDSASHIHSSLAKNGLFHYLNATTLYWKKWIEKSNNFLNKIDEKYRPLAKRSLLTIKAHTDQHGGILASADSGIYNYGRDYYSYVWPRDAHYSLLPLLKLGYLDEVRRYLSFISHCIDKKGIVRHKFLPDGSMGSSWHPLVQHGKPELNIQEDETASTVLLAIEFIDRIGQDSNEAKKLYSRIIYPCTMFLSTYIDESTGLPHASYDLWEQVFLTSTYTVSITYRALIEANRLSRAMNMDTPEIWLATANSIERNIGKLFSEKYQRFVRGIEFGDNYSEQPMIDIASLYGVSTYGPLHPNDTAVYATQVAVETYLQNPESTKGVIRYPGDDYMANGSGQANPWYVCTLMLGEHYVNLGDTHKAIEALDWTLDHASENGLLSEQLDPNTGEKKGVAPLVWSHAQFLTLLEKLYR